MKYLLIIILSTGYVCSVSSYSSKYYDDEDFNAEFEEELPVEDISKTKDFEQAVLKNFQLAEDNIVYWLFTRKNPLTPQIIENGNLISLWTSNYDGSKPLKVIAHGWGRNGTSPVNTMITAAFLDVADVNIIVVDWRESARGDYFTVSSRVPALGRFLGKFLNWLINIGGGNWDNVHLIGYSLGAHLLGNAGREVGGQPIRITGLDPAGPFWWNPFALNTKSGRYVEAIHTNILAMGITQPIGHVDFYPNGGFMQPGCKDAEEILHCSHRRSYQFFASSIRTNHFVGKKCTNLWQAFLNICNGSTLNMGNGILSKTGSGIYGVTTSDSWPF